MNLEKIAISLKNELLKKTDLQIKLNQSNAIIEKLEQFNQKRFAIECEKLDKNEEQAMADEGLTFEILT
jgi:uncharacterized protein YabE (DUF348 family)